VPGKLEHIKASKVLLGWSIPLLHELIDASSQIKGLGHGITGHNLDIINAANNFFGEKGRLEATLHILQDIGFVKEEDWRIMMNTTQRKRKRKS